MSNEIQNSTELTKEEKKREASRQYYQENKVRLCKYTIETGCMKAIRRDKVKAPAKAKEIISSFSYENYTALVKAIISRHGIGRSKYAWQECESASHMAYMYSIYRCAAEGYDYVDNYIRKMLRIYIVCAVIIASEDMKRASWDEGFERGHNRNNYY